MVRGLRAHFTVPGGGSLQTMPGRRRDGASLPGRRPGAASPRRVSHRGACGARERGSRAKRPPSVCRCETTVFRCVEHFPASRLPTPVQIRAFIERFVQIARWHARRNTGPHALRHPRPSHRPRRLHRRDPRHRPTPRGPTRRGIRRGALRGARPARVPFPVIRRRLRHCRPGISGTARDRVRGRPHRPRGTGRGASVSGR